MKALPGFNCKDCSRNTFAMKEYYMVIAPVWKQAKGGRGLLCIGCLEKRIARKLQGDDFTTAPINFIFPQSPRLKRRLA